MGMGVGRDVGLRCFIKILYHLFKAARRVALRQHTLEGDVLDVRLHPSLNDTPEPACTVSVRNFHVPSTTEEALRNYFETPMSEGGVVTAVEIHTREVRYPVAYVTFQNADGTMFTCGVIMVEKCNGENFMQTSVNVWYA